MSASCSLLSARKTMISSIRLMNSGRNLWLSSSIRSSFSRSKSPPVPRVLLDPVGTQVGGHDHDRVLEVDSASLRVSEPAVVEDLEQDVEDVRCAFSISSKRRTAYGRRRTASLSCPASS